MWTCISCQNENADRAGLCAYCGSRRPVAVESARELATKFEAAIFPNEKRSSLAMNRYFPFRVPVLLKLPERAIRAIGAAAGIALGLACSTLIYLFVDPSSMTGRLFNLRDPFTIVVVMILVVFFWGLVTCFLRYLRTRSTTRISHNSLLLDSMELVKFEGLKSVVQQLDTPAAQSSPLLSRLHSVSRHWATTPSLQDADLLLQQQLYTGEEEVRAGYSLLRTFIWALPVLGLLGTVAGVAVAVGGFAQFLGGDIEDVAVIKRSLVHVTAGLSYAFLTTLYGLGTALVLMLLTTGLQTREEKLLTSTHQSVANLFLPLLESVAPQRSAPSVMMLPGLQEQLTSVTAAVLEHVREQARESLKSFKDERDLLREDILHWGDLLKQKATDGAHDIGEALDRVGVNLANAQFDFLQKFESIKSEMDQQAASVLRSTADLTNTVTFRQQAMLQGIAEQNTMLDKNASALSELNTLTRDAMQLSEAVNLHLDTLRRLDLDQRAKDIVQMMESQRKEMEASRSALGANAAITSEVLVAQKSLTDSVHKLHEIKLDQTLRQFCDSLMDLKPVLENLREPFILQAVPIAKENRP